jgi:hypothetical protein
MRKVKAYQIKVDGTHQVIDMELDLKDYYKYTECDIIDIVYATIGGKEYDIIVDDEGLLKDGHVFTAFAVKSQSLLAGSIVVVGSDNKGGFKGLTDEDIENIQSNLHYTNFIENSSLALTMLEFEYANFN